MFQNLQNSQATSPKSDMSESFEREGRLWLRNALDTEDLAALDADQCDEAKPGQRLSISKKGKGMDTLIGAGSALSNCIERVLPGARPVRLVSFNKSPSNNWGVPWHQDRVIAVNQKHAVPGFENWSCKGGQWHCEPPVSLLEGMIFVRVHLDDADEKNGCLEIAPGSHRLGCVGAAEAADHSKKCETEICRARRGDVLILKMLVLHRSLPATEPSSRRTYRIDYSAEALPSPLNWSD
ncbi:MAG: phytanoyl-CoA dioxygenase family protein [Stappiaceae bacterium]